MPLSSALKVVGLWDVHTPLSLSLTHTHTHTHTHLCTRTCVCVWSTWIYVCMYVCVCVCVCVCVVFIFFVVFASCVCIFLLDFCLFLHLSIIVCILVGAQSIVCSNGFTSCWLVSLNLIITYQLCVILNPTNREKVSSYRKSNDVCFVLVAWALPNFYCSFHKSLSKAFWR